MKQILYDSLKLSAARILNPFRISVRFSARNDCLFTAGNPCNKHFPGLDSLFDVKYESGLITLKPHPYAIDSYTAPIERFPSLHNDEVCLWCKHYYHLLTCLQTSSADKDCFPFVLLRAAGMIRTNVSFKTVRCYIDTHYADFQRQNKLLFSKTNLSLFSDLITIMRENTIGDQ